MFYFLDFFSFFFANRVYSFSYRLTPAVLMLCSVFRLCRHQLISVAESGVLAGKAVNRAFWLPLCLFMGQCCADVVLPRTKCCSAAGNHCSVIQRAGWRPACPYIHLMAEISSGTVLGETAGFNFTYCITNLRVNFRFLLSIMVLIQWQGFTVQHQSW